MSARKKTTAAIPVVPRTLRHGTAGDAELLRLCGRFVALEIQAKALFAGGDLDDDDPRERAIVTAQDKLLPRICAIRARTIAGVQAKARAVATWAPDLMRPERHPYTDERLIASILSDLTGRIAA